MNLYVEISTNCQLPYFVLSIHIPGIAISNCTEVYSTILHKLPVL